MPELAPGHKPSALHSRALLASCWMFALDFDTSWPFQVPEPSDLEHARKSHRVVDDGGFSLNSLWSNSRLPPLSDEFQVSDL